MIKFLYLQCKLAENEENSNKFRQLAQSALERAEFLKNKQDTQNNDLNIHETFDFQSVPVDGK